MFFPPVERIESTSGRGNRMPGERRSYSPKFREDAVSLVIDASRSIAAVAREVGVAEETLSNWVDAYRRDRADGLSRPVPIPCRSGFSRDRKFPAPMAIPQADGGRG